jgi:hypothetical protein
MPQIFVADLCRRQVAETGDIFEGANRFVRTIKIRIEHSQRILSISMGGGCRGIFDCVNGGLRHRLALPLDVVDGWEWYPRSLFGKVNFWYYKRWRSIRKRIGTSMPS